MATTAESVLSSHPFTCNSCQVAFRTSEPQRIHMRSDWHRYNLKRRVASLPPITAEVFNEKVLTAQANSDAAAQKAVFERSCKACEKTYFSENAYQNHLGSQKHKARLASWQKGSQEETGSMLSSAFSLGEPVNTTKTQSVADSEAEAEFEKVVDGMKGTSLEEDDPLSWRPSRPHNSGFEDRPQHRLSSSTVESKPSSLADAANSELPLSRCLFCNYNSPTWQLSVAHMTKIHGLFIPEQSYLVNPEGMLRYFQRKITQNHECICCHKIKTTATGAQAHMRDKGHCKVAFETEEEMLEVGQFYDFSSTYSDDEDEDASSEDTEMGEASKNADRWVKLDGGDDGWETDSSASSLDSAELSAVPLDDHSHQYSKLSKHRHHAHDDPRSHRNRDGFHSHAHSTPRAVFYDDYELHLPSGRTAGHRSQARIFRQNLHNYPTPQERLNGSQRAIEAGRADEEGDAVMNETESARPERGNSHSGALIGRSEAGMLGVTDAQKREVRAAEKRDRRIGHQARNRYQARLEKQNNNQKHYRDPLLQ